MDMQSIKTFLMLAEVKRLGDCAKQLHLTKSAISTRIKQLEAELDQQLFERGAQGMKLTVQGQRFYRHALSLQRCWENAKREIRLTEQPGGLLRIGAHPALADDLLLDWAAGLRTLDSTQSLHLMADYSTALIQQVSSGILDIALILVAETAPGLLVERLFNDHLQMVSTDTDRLALVNPERYIYLDWGWGYNAAHGERLAQLQSAPVTSGLASLGTHWLQRQGGTAYLPARWVQEALAEGSLRLVKDAPRFERPVYATYSTVHPFPGRIALAMRALRQVIEKAYQHIPGT